MRAAGPGAPNDTSVVVVTLDAQGRVLVRAPVRTARKTAPLGFALLVPVAPEVAAVELRLGDEGLARIPRRPGRPELDIKDGRSAGELSWSYRHPMSAAPSFELEIAAASAAQRPMRTPMLCIGACERSLDVPLQRLQNDRSVELQLTVTDGWNVAS